MSTSIYGPALNKKSGNMENKPQAYIEILGAVAQTRCNLNQTDLRSIGEFTRENISNWMKRQRSTNWLGLLPVEDFHAVCGDVDIPWQSSPGSHSHLISVETGS